MSTTPEPITAHDANQYTMESEYDENMVAIIAQQTVTEKSDGKQITGVFVVVPEPDENGHCIGVIGSLDVVLQPLGGIIIHDIVDVEAVDFGGTALARSPQLPSQPSRGDLRAETLPRLTATQSHPGPAAVTPPFRATNMRLQAFEMDPPREPRMKIRRRNLLVLVAFVGLALVGIYWLIRWVTTKKKLPGH
ncbi:hypothetical protein FN846DRAFT_995626 [Sphaerosporella brunnea]|uniref:Uncharacterized protein n=1 Tax=Sphaerosporella brunnea TaxID=1250544 RepID=A0A5J5EJ68_9PEZI|nr:hypothetical protein FN846DRAFT_995626 [Sphaerosporella brunnea]